MAGRDDEAEPLRETARRLDELNSLIQRAATTTGRQDAELLLTLGSVCAELGFVPEARAWYRLVISRAPLDPRAQQAPLPAGSPPEGGRGRLKKRRILLDSLRGRSAVGMGRAHFFRSVATIGKPWSSMYG